MMDEKPQPKRELERLGYELIYKPHEEIATYMAFYRVEYHGNEIAPPIADKFDISLNEIWISKKLKPFEKYILHHELQEIKYRAEGYGVRKAHEKAIEDGEVWNGEPKYEELKREINLVSKEVFIDLTGFDKDLYQKLVKNRPFFDIEELREIDCVDPKKFKTLRENFWCI